MSTERPRGGGQDSSSLGPQSSVQSPGNAAAQASEGRATRGFGRNGQEHTDFFANVTLGNAGRPSTGRPYSELLNIEPIADFAHTYDMHRGNFDDHITASIPGYKDIQIIVGCAIAKTFWNGARLLDIGASEGSLAKAISSYTNGRVHSVVLDPSFAMREMFQGISTVAETTFVLAAFGRKVDEGELAWVEQDFFDREKKRPNPYAGMPVHFFRHKDEEPKFDIAHASMTFQFLSNERADQIERAKELLTSTGILIIEEKVITDRFVEFEDQKDKYKLQYFTSNDIEEKARVVLSGGMSRVKRVADGMNAKMIHVEVLERVLLENFNAIVQFWDCGNFKGYAASDNTRNLVRLVNNMISTTTEFSSVRTPKYLKPNAIMRLLSKMSVK